MSLEYALMFAEIEPEGNQHDGPADARNTARLIAKMERRRADVWKETASSTRPMSRFSAVN
jgi:inhibitor of KinA sporulation pathway (predicted exonuclease)